MNREREKALLPIRQAWIEHKPIQVRYEGGDWEDYTRDDPDFDNLNWEWRIKPSPREFWIVGRELDPPAKNSFWKHAWRYAFLDKGAALRYDERFTGTLEIIHVREVMEDTTSGAGQHICCFLCHLPVTGTYHSVYKGEKYLGVACDTCYANAAINNETCCKTEPNPEIPPPVHNGIHFNPSQCPVCGGDLIVDWEKDPRVLKCQKCGTTTQRNCDICHRPVIAVYSTTIRDGKPIFVCWDCWCADGKTNPPTSVPDALPLPHPPAP